MRYILHTSRLNMRIFDKSDARNLFELNSDSEVMRYTGDLPFEDISAAEQFIFDYDQYDKFKMGRWAVELKQDRIFLGWCGLKTNKDGYTDLGFRINKKHWGKGYATEASMACIKHGFENLGLHTIIARTSIKNIGAQKVLKKCGMQKLHTFRYKGIGDCFYYSIQNQKVI